MNRQHPGSSTVRLLYSEVKSATDRICGRTRPVTLTPLDAGAIRTAPRDPLDDRPEQPCEVWLALEFMQHTGSFKARGALNFLQAHQDAGTLPKAGVTIASGGNAGLACAWAARQQGVPATVFVPETAPAVKVAKLRDYGADVRLVGSEYAEALAACQAHAATTGALASHAYDDLLIAGGAGTLMAEIHAQIPDVDTVVVAVGGGGLFTGVATVAQEHGIRTIAVEPAHCRALNAAIEAGRPVDVTVNSIAADSLGARRTSASALKAAQRGGVLSVLVPDEMIVLARQALWDHRRIAVEHGAATALAALLSPDRHPHRGDAPPPSTPATSYRPAPGEKVVVVLCGANTDPTDLITR
ncbi:threonine/serine dehydratase [Streptomyces torulosus]|uniref:threonine/serine dehydratase n=1 Tax=Streptomyces torulosus TaxID=68276 RepID=UPI0006EBD23F|nr:threonine/serine dehydratase [Streptomyces torulosus]